MRLSQTLTKFFLATATILQLCCAALPAAAQVDITAALVPGNRHVKAELISDAAVLQPSAAANTPSARIGIKFVIEDGWHIYWKNPGDSGTPTKISWHLPDGWKAGDLRWPIPRQLNESGNITTFGYSDEVLLLTDLYTPSVETGSGEQVSLSADITFLVCNEQCFPGKLTAQKSFPFSLEAPLEPSRDFTLFSKYDALTSKSASILQSFERTRHVTVTPILSTRALIPGQQAELGLYVTNLYTPQQSAAPTLLQVFPENQSSTRLGLAQLSLLRNSQCGLAGCFDYLITLPVEVLASSAPGAVTLKGIVVFAPETYAEQTERELSPIAIDWAIDTQIEPSNSATAPNTKFQSLASGAEVPARLTYLAKPAKSRSVTPSEDSSEHQAQNIFTILILAFVAGLILNLMPCVLPILSIKVVGFLKHAHAPRRQQVMPALAYMVGILSSFLVLALCVNLLKDLGKAVGWGFQFQHPAYVVTLILVVFLLSLGFFELLEFRLPLLNRANRAVTKLEPSMLSHFFDGVLATALSTPCTAPFLGSALAFAFSQSHLTTIIVFLAIGLGLSLPYVLLATSPFFARLLPTPGAWMIKLRQLMGFCLLGTVVWLLFILNRQTEEGVIWSIALMLGVFVWVWVGRWLQDAVTHPIVATGLHLIFLVALATSALKVWPLLISPRSPSFSKSETTWREYSDERIAESLMAGRAVFVDFTADWCVTCKVNETLVLHTPEFENLTKQYNVTTFKGDWTRGDEAVTRALKRYHGLGVPHYVLINPHSPDKFRVLPTILTQSMLADAFKETLSK